ncbi:MAG TPA: hypothetical protein VFF06_04220 [Polyangia bacterium]|nr:hypothetical protein [Polyangia bacterium]
MTRILAASFAIGLCAWASCSASGGHPPTARIALAPAYVKLGDAYATDVIADGSASSAAIDDPLAIHPLAFDWTIDDPNARFSPDAHSPKVTVRVAGDHPVAIHLTVTDFAGDSGAVSAIVGVTVP